MYRPSHGERIISSARPLPGGASRRARPSAAAAASSAAPSSVVTCTCRRLVAIPKYTARFVLAGAAWPFTSEEQALPDIQTVSGALRRTSAESVMLLPARHPSPGRLSSLRATDFTAFVADSCSSSDASPATCASKPHLDRHIGNTLHSNLESFLFRNRVLQA